MARRRRDDPQPPAPRRRPLVASAAPVDLAQRGAAKLIEKRTQAWQPEAWAAFDGVGEIGHTLDYRANVISKVRLFAAIRSDEPDEPPLPMAAAVDAGLVGQADADLADQIVEDFDRGPGTAALLHKCSLNLDVPGDLHVVGEDEGEDETWTAYSLDELKDKSGKTTVPDAETGKSRELGPALSFRLWQPHPRNSGLSRSPLMPLVLEGLPEELLLISNEMRAGSKSRATKGLLGIAQEVVWAARDDATSRAAVEDAEGEPSLTEDIIAWATSAMDPGSTASHVPGIVEVPADYIERWAKHIDIGQKIDPQLLDRAKYIIDRIANGLPMPREVTLGLGDVNHWSAAVIGREGFRSYMEPTVLAIVNGFSVGALRPRMLASRVDPVLVRRLVVWYDPKDAIAPESKVETATEGVKLGALGNAAWRNEAGYDDEDAPTEEEQLQRLGLQRSILTSDLSLAILQLMGLVPRDVVLDPPAAPGQPALPPAPEPAPADEGDGTEPPDDTEPPAPFTAAAGPVALDVGERLAEIDRRLFDRVAVAAELAVERAVERANNRLRSLANRDPRAKAAATAAATPALGLGRRWSVRLDAGDDGQDDDTAAALVAGSFTALAGRVEAWITAAQAAVLAEVDATAPDELDGAERTQVADEQTEDRERGRSLLVAALTALSVAVLFGEHTVDGPGETDPTVVVPAGVVREVLAVAGGAQNVERNAVGGLSVDGRPVGGVATGERSRVLFARVRAAWTGYRWHYGDASTRQRPFEPHRRLAGQVFARWDAPELSNTETSWLPTTEYRPGDHRGCRCDFVPVVLAPPAQEAAA